MKHILLAILLIAAPVALFSGYELYQTNTAQAASPGLGDLSTFKTVIADVQRLADAGDLAGAAKRITDFETAWDQAETAIRPLDPGAWSNIDGAADAALSSVRRTKPDAAAVKSALADLMSALNDPSKPL